MGNLEVEPEMQAGATQESDAGLSVSGGNLGPGSKSMSQVRVQEEAETKLVDPRGNPKARV